MEVIKIGENNYQDVKFIDYDGSEIVYRRYNKVRWVVNDNYGESMVSDDYSLELEEAYRKYVIYKLNL